MVLQKRLDYGFNGYQVPPMPRSARSARVISSPYQFYIVTLATMSLLCLLSPFRRGASIGEKPKTVRCVHSTY